MPANDQRLHFLDALRGLAALSVMLFHFYSKTTSPFNDELASSLPAWADPVLEHLFSGVEVFFVLSGFVIAYSMRGSVATARYAGNFILRRSIRLDPPYWCGMLFFLLMVAMLWPTMLSEYYQMYGGWRGLLSNMFYLQNLSYFYPAKSVLDISWTLCLEVQFYLSYLLMLVAAHYVTRVLGFCGLSLTVCRRIRVGMVLALVVAVGVWSYMSWQSEVNFKFSGRAWAFFLGVLCFYALAPACRKAVVVVPFVLGLLALLVEAGVDYQLRSLVTFSTAIAIYLVGLSGRFAVFLNWRPLLYLGKTSYCIYLLHGTVGMVVLHGLSKINDRSAIAAWMSFALCIIISLVLADMMHRWVESPANRLNKRLKPGSNASGAG